MDFYKRVGLILPLISLLLGPCLSAQTRTRAIDIYFPDAGTEIVSSYGNNAKSLATLDSLINAINQNPLSHIVSIDVEGWASPSGTALFNKELSDKRGLVLKQLLVEKFNVPEGKINLSRSYRGIDYALLAKLVRQNNYQYADEVIAIINDEPAPGVWDTRKARLMNLRGGRVYNELAVDYFPLLRRSAAVTVYYIEPEPAPAPAPEPAPEPEPEPAPAPEPEPEPAPMPEPEPVVVPEPVPVVESKHYFSIHTNMLYDLAAIPNIGAEVYLGSNLSIAGNWWYAWWKNDSANKYWRTYGGYIAPRWWFGKAAHEKPLTGHHLGVYGEVLLYDFEWGGKGYLSGVPGKNIFHDPSWAAGVEYGFALPIARRLNIDFTVGLGYLKGVYREYEPMDDCYVWQATKMRHFVGPTKLEVSLVWLLGSGNVNAKKGGRK